jgi:hypothetical protein
MVTSSIQKSEIDAKPLPSLRHLADLPTLGVNQAALDQQIRLALSLNLPIDGMVMYQSVSLLHCLIDRF